MSNLFTCGKQDREKTNEIRVFRRKIAEQQTLTEIHEIDK